MYSLWSGNNNVCSGYSLTSKSYYIIDYNFEDCWLPKYYVSLIDSWLTIMLKLLRRFQKQFRVNDPYFKLIMPYVMIGTIYLLGALIIILI